SDCSPHNGCRTGLSGSAASAAAVAARMVCWVVVALGAIPAALFLYSRYVSQKPQIYVKVGTKWAETLRKIPVFEETYTPTWWCPFGWAQTIVRELFRDLPRLDWERELMRYPDGGQSALDWLHPKDERLREDATTPIVVFLPGITGSTHTAAYLLHAAVEVHARGWRAVVANGRGAGGVELLTPRLYNAGTQEATEDLGEVLKLISARYPDAKKVACGFSLGGMILWNYLARCDTKEAARVDSAMVVSSPWHSMATTVSLEQPFNCFIFNKGILRNCLKLVEPLKPMFKDRLDWEHLMASETMRHFDARFITPLAGLGSVEEYYEATSLAPKVARIPVPTLSVNAADDAFSPTHSIPFNDVCRSANVAVCLTAHGGHTAFMQGANPNDPGFIEKLIVQFGDAIFAE
ncbi:abhd-3.1, partial [Pristionchus pacificus]